MDFDVEFCVLTSCCFKISFMFSFAGGAVLETLLLDFELESGILERFSFTTEVEGSVLVTLLFVVDLESGILDRFSLTAELSFTLSRFVNL